MKRQNPLLTGPINQIPPRAYLKLKLASCCDSWLTHFGGCCFKKFSTSWASFSGLTDSFL